jgi:membrane carboxypeptidase/penicillin-binding protein PbpC
LKDKKTKYRLLIIDLSGKDYETKVLSIYPGKVRTWMELNGFPVDTIPEAHPDCTLFIGENGPKIDSPSNNAVYYIKGNIIDKEQQIVLRAHPEKGNKTVYWFIDDFPFGSSLVGEDLIYTPKKGGHTLIAMDEEGRTSKIKFNVVDINDKNDESSID